MGRIYRGSSVHCVQPQEIWLAHQGQRIYRAARYGEDRGDTIPNHTISYYTIPGMGRREEEDLGFIEQLREGSVHTDWACTE